MKTFEVYITREIYETAVVTVKAKTKDAAEAIVYDERYQHHYETSDDVGEIYISDCIEIEEEPE